MSPEKMHLNQPKKIHPMRLTRLATMRVNLRWNKNNRTFILNVLLKMTLDEDEDSPSSQVIDQFPSTDNSPDSSLPQRKRSGTTLDLTCFPDFFVIKPLATGL